MYNNPMYSMEPPAAAVRPTARMILTKVGFEFSNCYKLGSGRYSKVYKGLYKDASRHFAIKIIDLEKISAEFKQKFLPREMAVWRMLDHAGHVFLYKDFQKYGYHFAIMELGIEDMLTHVQRNGPIEQGQSRGWMLQLIDALKYMHGKGIAHRDLKLENVLLFDGGILKIADYGFCKQSSDLASTFCGSKSYSAPEILRGIRYDTFKADIWSLGVLAFIMVTNTMPFREDVDNVVIIDAQRHRRYHFSNRLGLTTECTATIDRMLTFDPKTRPIISECAHLPWFNSGGGNEDGNDISNFLPINTPPPMADITNNIRPQTSKGGAGGGGHHHHHHHQRRSNNYYYNNNNGGGHNNGMAHG